MSKKLFVVLGLFLLILPAALIISQTERAKQKFPTLSLSQTTPTPITESTLSFAQNPLITTRGATTSAEIVLESHGPLPQLLQLEIAYDPVVLTDMSIKTGSLFTEATVILNKVNPFTGRISYAIEIDEAHTQTQQNGTIATLTFTPSLAAWQEETYLNFLPKTNIKGETEENSLQSGYGVRIIIK